MAAEKKKIAIIGAGPVGCAFAVHLVKAEHEVTIVGRGQRLADLKSNGGIVAKKSEKATETTKTPVNATDILDTSYPWDLVLLTITEHQYDKPLADKLRALPQTTQILFMFNTFASLDTYFDALGKDRCIMGFPIIMASFFDGALVHQFFSFGQSTIVSSAEWRTIFSAAGIPCIHEPDMQSWLRTHAAVVIAFQSAAVMSLKKGAGVSWSEASLSANASREALTLVQKLGHPIIPSFLYYLCLAAPSFVLTGVIWGLMKMPSMRNNPQVPKWEGEVTGLVDSMVNAAPSSSDVRLVSQLKAKIQ